GLAYCHPKALQDHRCGRRTSRLSWGVAPPFTLDPSSSHVGPFGGWKRRPPRSTFGWGITSSPSTFVLLHASSTFRGYRSILHYSILDALPAIRETVLGASLVLQPLQAFRLGTTLSSSISVFSRWLVSFSFSPVISTRPSSLVNISLLSLARFVLVDLASNSNSMLPALNTLSQALKDKVVATLGKGTRSIDGPGWVYAYIIVGGAAVPDALLVKAGASNNWERRMGEWERQCAGEEQVWLIKIPALYRFYTGEILGFWMPAVLTLLSAESVAHDLLEHQALSRPIEECVYCKRQHQERFVFAMEDPYGVNVERAVIDAIELAVKIVAEHLAL
ncbi:hypothetical protein V5O48_019150, partial [Marasmius crinis-equi]